MNSKYKKKKELRTYLANCGWQEIITYSLISLEERQNFIENEAEKVYQLLMPKSEYHKYYRQTLVPSHLKTIKYNLSYGNKNLFFFEISSVASPSYQEDLLILSGIGKLINQPLHRSTPAIDFYGIKGVLENIFQLCQIQVKISFSPTTLKYLNSSQSAEILLEKEKIGFLGQINPQITHNYQINEPIFVAQISLSKIFNYLDNFPPQVSYRPVSNFPVSERDLSFAFPENIDYNEVVKAMKQAVDNQNLQEISVFDIYQNSELAQAGKKSVSFHLIFQSPTTTLKSKEVEKMLEGIIKKVEKLFAAKLRD